MMFPEKSATFPDHASVCERLAMGTIRCPVSAHIAFGACDRAISGMPYPKATLQ
jgi:hypothetical protein